MRTFTQKKQRATEIPVSGPGTGVRTDRKSMKNLFRDPRYAVFLQAADNKDDQETPEN